MTMLATFLQEVLVDGRICLDAPPIDGDPSAALTVLRRAYDVYALSIAGPRLPLDDATALAAGRLLHRAAWYVLNPGMLIEAPEKTLAMPMTPSTPAQHLSADLVLRYLPTLHRRSSKLMPDDELPAALERVLREWPLSGVLADIAEAPFARVNFGEHAGVNFLYAERLARRERPGWFPLGHGMEYVELVWQQLGKDISVLPALAGLAQEISMNAQGTRP